MFGENGPRAGGGGDFYPPLANSAQIFEISIIIRLQMDGLLITAALLAILGSPTQADGYFEDGHKLQQQCQGGEGPDRSASPIARARAAFDAGRCVGYIAGVMDGLTSEENSAMMCMPEIRLGQAEALVRSSLETHPQSLHMAAPDLSALALGEAFPCGRLPR